MKQSRWTVYCHVHRESGRRYVGVTKKTWRQRWNQHVYTSTKLAKKGWSHFANAIRKYGPDAFDHEVLETCGTLEEANEAEARWIERFGTRDPEKGFNIKKGGDHRPHPIRNPWDRSEYRRKASVASKRKWEDPGFRAAVTAGVTEAWKDPSHRERMSEISREVNARPEVKAAISAAASFRPGKSSRFRGVCWNKALGKWRVSFRYRGKMVNVGHFLDEDEAARAYDREVSARLGDGAALNFPDPRSGPTAHPPSSPRVAPEGPPVSCTSRRPSRARPRPPWGT